MDLIPINSTIFILDASLEITKIISREVTAAPGSRVGTSAGAAVCTCTCRQETLFVR